MKKWFPTPDRDTPPPLFVFVAGGAAAVWHASHPLHCQCQQVQQRCALPPWSAVPKRLLIVSSSVSKQRELLANGLITQRAFCCSPEVQLGEHNGQADSRGNDYHPSLTEHPLRSAASSIILMLGRLQLYNLLKFALYKHWMWKVGFRAEPGRFYKSLDLKAPSEL